MIEKVTSYFLLIRCDTCKVKPIVGPRYHCLVCEDWDFCQGCFGNEEYHNHAFVRIDNDSLPPVYVGPPGSQKKAPKRDVNDSSELQRMDYTYIVFSCQINCNICSVSALNKVFFMTMNMMIRMNLMKVITE